VKPGVNSGSGGFSDQRFWLSVVLGLGAGAVIAYLGLPSYFNDGIGMSVVGYGVFMIGGGVLGSIVGSLLLRPDAGH
jgi:hypothetical protein